MSNLKRLDSLFLGKREDAFYLRHDLYVRLMGPEPVLYGRASLEIGDKDSLCQKLREGRLYVTQEDFDEHYSKGRRKREDGNSNSGENTTLGSHITQP